MLAAKWFAYLQTGSSVIFSDATESIIHIVAVWFAWYALRVTARPPDTEHHFGHEKVAFISAGTEGGLICIASIFIIITAVNKLGTGVVLQRLDIGIAITAGAGMVNAGLGYLLVRNGKKHHSLVVEANGKHVLTDAWTSAGAVGGLILARITNQLWLDPIMAILFAANILREGSRLIITSINGLMDRTDLKLERQCRIALDEFASHNDVTYHRFRLRMMGSVPHIDFHIQIPDHISIAQAHQIATQAEDHVKLSIGVAHAEVMSHLEPMTVPKDHI